MTSNTPLSEELFITDNVIVGMGEVPAMRTPSGLCWILPGNEVTYNKEEAVEVATRLDRIIRANLSKYKRTLFR